MHTVITSEPSLVDQSEETLCLISANMTLPLLSLKELTMSSSALTSKATPLALLVPFDKTKPSPHVDFNKVSSITCVSCIRITVSPLAFFFSLPIVLRNLNLSFRPLQLILIIFNRLLETTGPGLVSIPDLISPISITTSMLLPSLVISKIEKIGKISPGPS